MIGEIQFQQKRHAEAVKSFFRVVYGYAYPQWQAEACYEAARCFEVLGKKSPGRKSNIRNWSRSSRRATRCRWPRNGSRNCNKRQAEC